MFALRKYRYWDSLVLVQNTHFGMTGWGASFCTWCGIQRYFYIPMTFFVCHSAHSLSVIPAKAGIQKKEVWIPNQVGDDRYIKSSWGYIYVFWFVRIFFFIILIKNWPGSSIKDFEDDSGCAFEDDSGCAFEDDSGFAFGNDRGFAFGDDSGDHILKVLYYRNRS